MRRLVFPALLLAAGTQAHAQSTRTGWSEEYKQNLRQAAARRHYDVRRHNSAQAEAQRLVSQGLGMLYRPVGPGYVQRPPLYYNRPREVRRYGW